MTTVQTVPISLRPRSAQLSLIDRAAAARGKDRTSFMMEASCREAENVLLDRRLFQLDENAWTQLTAILDAPPEADSQLHALLTRKPLWKR